jgi:transposase
MVDIKRIGVDTSKSIFTIHAADAQGRVVIRRDLRRGQLVAFFAKQPTTEIVLEACGGSHHWARVLGALGHTVKLIPAQYVKPFVKRGKNDRNDAEAICEAASRPSMSFVPVKSAQQQADLLVLRMREMAVGQRTQLVNALRGHATEFGVIAGRGLAKVETLLAEIAANDAVPQEARAMLAMLGREIAHHDAHIEEIDVRLRARHKANPLSQALAAIPGIGPITALSLVGEIDASRFHSGRHLAAWIGLTPKERSTGGKQRMGGISRAGNERLRSLLVLGATSVIRHAKPGSKTASAWLLNLLERRPRKVAAVALANKIARIVWAMMSTGEAYRGTAPQAG